MREGIADEAAFADLAREVFLHQMRWNGPYARFVRAQFGGADADAVVRADWRRIPAVSTDVFKLPGLPVVCGEANRAANRFFTSGTTRVPGEARGTHHLHALDAYEASIEAAWRQLELPMLAPCFLMPPPADPCTSSLGHMTTVLRRFLPDGGGYFVEADGTLRREALLQFLRASPGNRPVLVMGTALAFLHLFEAMEAENAAAPALPRGSMALETGGYKGTGRSLEKGAFYAMFERHLGLAAGQVINEYSMTELSSQFYTRGVGNPHRGPAWARVRVMSAETREEVAVGETGHLQVFDLANIDSVLAIQTKDLAVRRDDGAFDLVGRDPSALPRGCSRAADEHMSANAGLLTSA